MFVNGPWMDKKRKNINGVGYRLTKTTKNPIISSIRLIQKLKINLTQIIGPDSAQLI